MDEMSCQELVELVTEYLEGALPDAERARFENHLRGCDGCTHYVEQMRRTIQLTGKLSEQSMSDEARNHLLSAFRSWKNEKG
jgi:anti-sigma factor RsiW